MPIHLAPISRRQFLQRSLAAGAALVIAPRVLAAEKSVDANSWALFSDPHLAADRSLVFRSVNMTQHFQKVSTEVLALPSLPAGVLINGDCAYSRGEKEDYSLLAELLRPIREQQIHVHLSLGNHDNRERFWDALEDEKTAKRPLADRQVALVRASRVNWFILDSLEITLQTPGLLGQEQLDWLGSALDANTDKPALVMVHHNPGIAGGNMGLKDTMALMEVIRPRKQVKAYIYGHTHHWAVQKDTSGIHMINLPPVGYVFTEGEPSGWVHSTIGNDEMKLELRCVDQTHKAHGQKVTLPWRA